MMNTNIQKTGPAFSGLKVAGTIPKTIKKALKPALNNVAKTVNVRVEAGTDELLIKVAEKPGLKGIFKRIKKGNLVSREARLNIHASLAEIVKTAGKLKRQVAVELKNLS